MTDAPTTAAPTTAAPMTDTGTTAAPTTAAPTTAAPMTDTGPDGAHGSTPWWRSTWTIRRAQWVRLAVALAAVVAAGVLIGAVVTRWTDPNPVTDLDRRLAERLAANRTGTRDALATWGARAADTPVKIGVTALVVGLMLWRWRRWHEAAFVALTLIFEATAFITITAIVQRSRPDVPRLLDSPVDSSFPSGHVAAATVYGAFVVVVFWRTRAVWARALAVGVAAVLPVVVGLARMYQGMHFLSDVVAGIGLGLVALGVCWSVVGSPPDAADGKSAIPSDTAIGAGASAMADSGVAR